MLPKSRRLTSTGVVRVLKAGKGASSGPIRIKYVPRKGGAVTSRFSVIVSKKIKKLATDRNRLRRQVFAILHDTEPSFPIEAAVFVSMGDVPQKQIKASLEEIFTRMRS